MTPLPVLIRSTSPCVRLIAVTQLITLNATCLPIHKRRRYSLASHAKGSSVEFCDPLANLGA